MIITGFVIDITLHGVTKEVGVLVIVLRLWRVFEIIEELSAASEGEIDELWEKVEQLESEMDVLKRDREKVVQERDSLLRKCERFRGDGEGNKGGGQDLL